MSPREVTLKISMTRVTCYGLTAIILAENTAPVILSENSWSVYLIAVL